MNPYLQENNYDYHSGTSVQSAGWIVDARWYYAFLAFLLGIIAQDKNSLIPHATLVLLGVLLLVLACNAFFYYVLRRTDVVKFPAQMRQLNIIQVGFDLLFFFLVLLMTGGGISSVGHTFFFIPIFVSTIIFGFEGALIVAIFSGFLLLTSVLAYSGVFSTLMVSNFQFTLTPDLSLSLTQTAIIFVVYLLIAFFGGHLAKLLRARDILLLEQLHKEGEHVSRLEELTKEFDKSAKLLVRRDLELSGANEKLIQLDKMKSEIISVAAHQLRTPLSAIKWTIKILIDGDAGTLNNEQRELLAKGFESNERMIHLVNDMLAVDRMESGKYVYVFVPVQFETLVRDMISELAPIAEQKNIRIEFNPPQIALPKIKVDPDKMRDVLQNLIDNAIKYTKKDGTIVVGLQVASGNLHFSVKDSGIGIPETEKDKIFSRFFRAQNASHSETDGSGLGLFIAQSIVKRHGGRIWFESAENVGSTFHIELPYEV